MKVKFIGAHYENSDCIEFQGKRNEALSYLKKGYEVKEERNGYWVLIKTVKIIVTVIDKNSQYHNFEVKNKILELYQKSRISEKLFQKFLNDAKSEKIKFYLTEYGGLIIQSN